MCILQHDILSRKFLLREKHNADTDEYADADVDTNDRDSDDDGNGANDGDDDGIRTLIYIKDIGTIFTFPNVKCW